MIVALTGCATTQDTLAPTPPTPRAFRVEVTGSGPPVILIPGLASSGEAWAQVVTHLRARHTCHVITLAGFGGVPPTSEPLLSAVKAELAAYVTSRRLEQPVIVGHSLGGTIALDFAAEHPRLAGPLVIVDALPFFAGIIPNITTLEDARPIVEGMRGALSAQTQTEYEAGVRAGTQTKAMVTRSSDHELLVRWGLTSDRRTVNATLVDLFATDLRDKLARVGAPTLVIGTWVGWQEAGGDRTGVVQRFRDQYAELRRLHFAMSDTARHFVMLDDLPWFLAQLDGFLANPDEAVRDRGFPPG